MKIFKSDVLKEKVDELILMFILLLLSTETRITGLRHRFCGMQELSRKENNRSFISPAVWLERQIDRERQKAAVFCDNRFIGPRKHFCKNLG